MRKLLMVTAIAASVILAQGCKKDNLKQKSNVIPRDKTDEALMSGVLPAEGTYKIVTWATYNAGSEKAIGVAGASVSAFATIEQQPYVLNQGQEWVIKSVGGGDYVIINAKSEQALSVGATTPGSNVDQYPQTGQDGQKWKVDYVALGQYRIKPKLNTSVGLYLTGGSTANGAQIKLGNLTDNNSFFMIHSLSNDPANTVLVPNTGGWAAGVNVYKDLQYNNYFSRYRNLVAEDRGASTLLPDGSIFWSFGDSYMGEAAFDRSILTNKVVFVRNAGVIQKGEMFSSFKDLNPGVDQFSQTWLKYGSSPEHIDYYWPMDATVKNGKLQVLLSHVNSWPPYGMWDFGQVSIDIAQYDLANLSAAPIVTTNKYVGLRTYGSALLEDGTPTYIYGTYTDASGMKHAQLAKSANGSMSGTWEYLTAVSGGGTPTWSASPNNYSIVSDVADQFSVWKTGSTYYMLAQEKFGDKIYVYKATQPWGPWTNKKLVLTTPPALPAGTGFTFNAMNHPELSKNGELVVGYSVQTAPESNKFNVPNSADRYRMHFYRITGWQP